MTIEIPEPTPLTAGWPEVGQEPRYGGGTPSIMEHIEIADLKAQLAAKRQEVVRLEEARSNAEQLKKPPTAIAGHPVQQLPPPATAARMAKAAAFTDASPDLNPSGRGGFGGGIRSPEPLHQVQSPPWQQQMWRWPQAAGMEMPTCRSAFAVAELAGLSYAVGGILDETITQVRAPCAATEIFNPVTNMWHHGPPLNDARYGHGIAVAQGCIFVAGGQGLHGTLCSMEVLDPAVNAWRVLSPMPVPVKTLRLAQLGAGKGQLYAMSGRLDIYFIEEDRWEAAKPAARLGHGPVDDEEDEAAGLPTIGKR